MSYGLLVITDGRADCISRTIPSALEHLQGTCSWRVIYDDSGDAKYRAWLVETFEPLHFGVLSNDQRLGFGGAIQAAWGYLNDHVEWDTARHVVHLEDDFTFNGDVDVDAMCDVLDQQPHLQQMALRRQPCNREELVAGGVVEANPLAYQDCTDMYGQQWLEHRQFWTTNPCVYRRSLCSLGWPDGERSEATFSGVVLADVTHRCGYWGPRTDPPLVHHIGDVRTGTGY